MALLLSRNTNAQNKEADKAYRKALKAYDKGRDRQEVRQMLIDAGSLGSVDAYIKLAQMEGFGGVFPNVSISYTAVPYYQMAAALGSYEAKLELAKYWVRKMFDKNADSALKYARSMVPGVEAATAVELHQIFRKGRGDLNPDPKMSYIAALIASMQDHSNGDLFVARCWADSIGTFGMVDSALDWYQRAIAAGDYRAKPEAAAYVNRPNVRYELGGREYRAAHPDHQRLSAADFGPSPEDARRQADWERAHPLPQQQAAYKSTQPTIELVKHKSQDDIDRENNEKAKREAEQREKAYNDKWGRDGH